LAQSHWTVPGTSLSSPSSSTVVRSLRALVLLVTLVFPPAVAIAQTPPVYFVVQGNITNGDQFDSGFPFTFTTASGGGSASRLVPIDLAWGSLSLGASISDTSVTVAIQGAMDAVNFSRICNIFYGCGWSPTATTNYSGIDVYVLGEPGTPFHILHSVSGALNAAITQTRACERNYANAQAQVLWVGDPTVQATTEHGTGGFCGIPAPKSGAAAVSENHVVSGTSRGPTVTHNGRTYSYAYGAPVRLSMSLYAEGEPGFSGHVDANVTVRVAAYLSPPPRLTVSPVPLDFGLVGLNNSKTRQMTVQNTGPAGSVLTGTVRNPSPPFGISSGSGAFSLPSGETKVLEVGFQPTTLGAHSEYVTIESNDPDMPSVSVEVKGEVVETVRLWINAFIPSAIPEYTIQAPPPFSGTVIPGPFPGQLYSTDQRSFATNRDAHSRMHSEVRLEIPFGPAMVEEQHRISKTTKFTKSDGSYVIDCEKTGDNSRMRFRTSGSSQVIRIEVYGASNNPCAVGSPDIDYRGTITIDVPAEKISFSGYIDAFPAYEMYMSINEQPARTMFNCFPESGKTPWNLVGGPTSLVVATFSFNDPVGQWNCGPSRRLWQPLDSDADGRADLAVFRPSSGGWFVRHSSQAYSVSSYNYYQWGLPGDVPVAGDFDGDGMRDLVVWRSSIGGWFVRKSSNDFSISGYDFYQWGLPGDVPLATDFDGDGRADLAVWRPSNGTWYVRYSSLAYDIASAQAFQWGLPGDEPKPTDFDGDGRTDLVVWRPSNGWWFVRYSADDYDLATAGFYQWGLWRDVPAPADFDGDGRSDLVVWRPVDGNWFIRYSSRDFDVDQAEVIQWGLPGDVPTAVDFDGDGRADPAVWRPLNGTWYVRNIAAYQWGLVGDVVIKP
jgi:hypothetical protein